MLSAVVISLGTVFSMIACADASQCNADNCLRNLRATGTRISAASSFCATYTQGTSTATTGFPTFATSACMNDPSRFSSACSCLPTASPTTSTTTKSTTSPSPTCNPLAAPVIVNGGFESGQLSPWYLQNDAGASSYLISPGLNSAYALHSDNENDGSSPYSHSDCFQKLTTCPGVTYTVTFDYRFDDNSDAYVYGQIDGQIIGEYGNSGAGGWQHFSAQFVAQSTSPILGLGATPTEYESANFDFDNANVVPVIQTSNK